MEPMWAALTGASLRHWWHELERTQFLSADMLRDRQEQRLRRLSASACRDTAFYEARFREAGVGPELRSIDDLRKLPILTKHDIRAHSAEMISRRVNPQTLLEFRTGGSTGVPLTIFIDEEVSHQRNAAARRSNLWSDWKVGESVGAVWGNPHLPATIKERLRNELLDPVIYLDTMTLSAESVRAFALEWRRERPTLLFGHAHSLFLLASIIRELGVDDVRPRAIISTSMTLIEPERRVIEEVFGLKVFDRYGCEELGLIGCECDLHAGMHINVDHLIVEFLRDDGQPVAPGETGYLVVTDLINDTMPFIRYRVEDMAAPIAGMCACGRGLPLMERVAGRVADFLVRVDGTKVAGISLIENSLTKFAGIDQMQIVQEELRRITLRIVPAATFASAAQPHLQQYFESTFPGARVAIELTTSIPRERNGKYRFSICQVSH